VVVTAQQYVNNDLTNCTWFHGEGRCSSTQRRKKLARISTHNTHLAIGHHKTPSEVTMCAQILEFKQLEIPVILHTFIQYADYHSHQVIFYTNSLPFSYLCISSPYEEKNTTFKITKHV
jgi:hypothetical protein